MAKPEITEKQFEELERNMRDALNYQFRQVSDCDLSTDARIKITDFINDLLNEETDEA